MVVIQNYANFDLIDENQLVKKLEAILSLLDKQDSEVVYRFVDESEIIQLNKTYRGQNKATNVLSFPSDLPKEIDELILGDVVICTNVITKEAKEQNKVFDDHLTHIALHGTLHLLGYDHIENSDAEIMESLEIEILEKMKIANPYE